MEALLNAGLMIAPKIVNVLARWLDPSVDLEQLKRDTRHLIESLGKWQDQVEKNFAERDRQTEAAITKAQEGG